MGNSFITDETPAGAFEKRTISSSAVGITSTLLNVNESGGFHKRAAKAFITVETQSIRLRWDGSDPTTTDGHLLTNGSSITIIGENNVLRLRMIAAAADGTAQITVYYNR